MTYAFILLFCLLLAINVMYAKDLLYPPALFVATWVATLVGLEAFSDTFYRVTPETLAVFAAGAIAFSAGGMLAFTPNGSRPIPVDRSGARLLMDIALFVVAVALPFYWFSIGGELETGFLAEQRDAAVDAAYSSERSFTLTGNLILLSSFLAIALHVENDGTWPRRWRAYLAIALALGYVFLTGSKGGLKLLLVLFFISSLKNGSSLLRLVATLGLFVVLFGAALVAVNYAYLDFDITPELLELVGMNIVNYWLGSLVAFEQIVRDPNYVISHHHLGRFFLETANGFGARYDIPSIHAPFTATAMYLESNTYTIYFSYFKDLGWAGVFLGLGALGALCTSIYNAARRGRPIALAFFGILSLGVVLSIQSEQFVLQLNGHIKMLVFLWCVYVAAPWMARWRIMPHSA